MSAPYVSIITATYNSSATIADSVHSVNFQTIPAEHIIIDGKSLDNTLALVRQNSTNARIISEIEAGIYDPMNKGIRFATGDIMGILNSYDL